MTKRKKPNYLPSQTKFFLAKQLESRADSGPFETWEDACTWAEGLAGQSVTKKNLEHCILTTGKKPSEIVKNRRGARKETTMSMVTQAIAEIESLKQQVIELQNLLDNPSAKMKAFLLNRGGW